MDFLDGLNFSQLGAMAVGAFMAQLVLGSVYGRRVKQHLAEAMIPLQAGVDRLLAVCPKVQPVSQPPAPAVGPTTQGNGCR